MGLSLEVLVHDGDFGSAAILGRALDKGCILDENVVGWQGLDGSAEQENEKRGGELHFEIEKVVVEFSLIDWVLLSACILKMAVEGRDESMVSCVLL